MAVNISVIEGFCIEGIDSCIRIGLFVKNFEKSFSDWKNVSITSRFFYWKLKKFVSDFQIEKRENVTNNEKASETLDGRKTLDHKSSERKSEN